MKYVYAFDYADVNDEEPRPLQATVTWPEKHLVAGSFDDALAKARQFLIDDGLRSDFTLRQGQDFQIVSVRRLMAIDWPFEREGEADG